MITPEFNPRKNTVIRVVVHLTLYLTVSGIIMLSLNSSIVHFYSIPQLTINANRSGYTEGPTLMKEKLLFLLDNNCTVVVAAHIIASINM